MYFVPALIAATLFLAFPSWTVALTVAGLAWMYLTFAGRKPHAAELSRIRLELAFRTLSVKALAISGDYDQLTYDVHTSNTPDLAENSTLRALLRDAAGASHEGWKGAAKRVRKGARKDQVELHALMTGLVIQMTSQPSARGGSTGNYVLTDEKQRFLKDVGKMWGIGPRNICGILIKNRVQPGPDLAFA